MPKTALITGASRGIGRAIAEALGALHYDLYLVCHTNAQLLAGLKEQLEQTYSIRCHCFTGDIGSYEFVKAVFDRIDTLDVLINNAGISHIGLLTELSVDDWHRIIDTNLSSVFYTSKLAASLMLQKHAGSIISISSVWGSIGASMEVAYSASKGGVNSFTRALAKELAPSGISVNAIACGVIDTDMNRCFDEDERLQLIEEIPACRMGEPGEVARLVCQLIDAPSYLTGQIITLDGGWQ
ncbi:MAG: SDR family NAD(P)-dependent oxidoreductase [Lachnospiraceae bacterium]|nr:SDR family NAD(P)-dependent oxidoreductase [Lachnospiraceae bacterium]